MSIRKWRNLVNIYNGAAPGASTNIQVGAVDLDLEPVPQGSAGGRLRFLCSFENDTEIGLEITPPGAAALPIQYLNRKTPILADSPEWLETPVYAGEMINVQIDVDGIIRRLAIDFVQEGSDA